MISKKIIVLVFLVSAGCLVTSFAAASFAYDYWTEAENKLAGAKLAEENRMSEQLEQAKVKLSEANKKLNEAKRLEGASQKLAEANKKLEEADRKLAEAKTVQGQNDYLRENLAEANKKLAEARQVEAETQPAAPETKRAEQKQGTSGQHIQFESALAMVAQETRPEVNKMLGESSFCLRNQCTEAVVLATIQELDRVVSEVHDACMRLGEKASTYDRLTLNSMCIDFTMELVGNAADDIAYDLNDKYFGWG